MKKTLDSLLLPRYFCSIFPFCNTFHRFMLCFNGIVHVNHIVHYIKCRCGMELFVIELFEITWEIGSALHFTSPERIKGYNLIPFFSCKILSSQQLVAKEDSACRNYKVRQFDLMCLVLWIESETVTVTYPIETPPPPSPPPFCSDRCAMSFIAL